MSKQEIGVAITRNSEREMTLDEYKKYRVGILKEMYIRLTDEQMKHLEGLTTTSNVDHFLRDIMMNSDQDDGPSSDELINKAFNKISVNRKRTEANAAKRTVREARKKHAVL